MSGAFNNVILESRAKKLVTMLEEIRNYIMEIWESNRMRFLSLDGGGVLPNLIRELERTSTYTNL